MHLSYIAYVNSRIRALINQWSIIIDANYQRNASALSRRIAPISQPITNTQHTPQAANVQSNAALNLH